MSKTTKLSELSWGQKFALIDTYKLSDEVACSKMGVTPNELKTAKKLLSEKTFSVDTSFDSSRYAEAFDPDAKPAKKTTGSTTHKTNSTSSASTGTPKKRGRKGDKITKAFQSISATPLAVDAFIRDHNISLAVLRQSKRFDKSGIAGTVHVKKREGALMVWREVPIVPKAD
jgi:hypothetical protein